MKIYRVHSANYAKRVEDLHRTGGASITKPFTNWKKETQKVKSHSKVKCTFYPVNWTWKVIELEKKDPLSASFKMLESSNDYKIGRRLKLESDVLTF